jgi:hypothetical protein
MSSRKRKVAEEMRICQEKWAPEYFFMEFKQKALCLICKDKVTVMKNYNLKRHYDTKHASKYNDLEGHFQTCFKV